MTIDEAVLSLSFAIARSNKLIDKNWKINQESKIDLLLSKWIKEVSKPEEILNYFKIYEINNLDDDILGAFYQSIQKISQKSDFGSYYTPSELLKDIKIPLNKTILDPCCGSGNILLNILSKKHNPSQIYARDIDETALKICFINLALYFNNKNITPNLIKQDITLPKENDLFSYSAAEQFDYIVTNPPWGSKFSEQQKKKLIELYPDISTSEIFSISLYNAAKMLKKFGELYFFLPHSFLNVKTHKNIRKYIFQEKNKISIKLLGNAFKGVLSESLLLHMKNNVYSGNVSIENKIGITYELSIKNIKPPEYIVCATCNTKDNLLLEKISSATHTTLNGNAVFALGIVTGNNNKYLKEQKTENTEPVFRGRDIEKYVLPEPKYFLDFQPKLYQQAAGLDLYRQKKIVYRFISEKLICALDVNGSLLLNSANLIISKEYPMESLAALFNSDIYSFIFKKKFHSTKVLKSHLQDMPLPILSGEDHKFIKDFFQEAAFSVPEKLEKFQKKVDQIICKSFGISEKEYCYIKEEITAKGNSHLYKTGFTGYNYTEVRNEYKNTDTGN